MRKIVIERRLLTKDVWEVPGTYALGDSPLDAASRLLSTETVCLAPDIYRIAAPDESRHPAIATLTAERGYWSRLMSAWRQFLRGEL